MIAFDISRLVGRAGYATPTGIERVELAYAEFLTASDAPVCFARASRWGRLTPLPRSAVRQYVAALGSLWRDGSGIRRRLLVRWAVLRMRFVNFGRRRAFAADIRAAATKPAYLLVSHHHLENRRVVTRIMRRHGLAFVCLIHDLIPIEFPEYARPGQDDRHRRRIETAAALADAVIVPSLATGQALQPYIDRSGRRPRVLAAPFGVDPPPLPARAAAEPQRPYFVCLGTIEARKNHLLLLNLWRDLVAERGAQTPALMLIGRRGWEVESAIDMLDRCPALRGTVFERSALSDTETARLIAAARALLLPSFAEGFGFPVAEALALGTPVLASTVPALREVGGGVPEYLDPLDGAAWRAAVLDYSLDPSARRQAQLQRLADWQPPRWADHFAAVERLLADLPADAGLFQAEEKARRPRWRRTAAKSVGSDAIR